MNYQSIRASIETPMLNAFSNLVPAIPVYFDNITAAPPNSTTEYIRINITFGLTSESSLTTNFDNVRGSVVIRVFTEKGRGPGRNQVLMNTALETLNSINDTVKVGSAVYTRIFNINGPTFSTTETPPLFMSRIDAGFQAQVVS